MIGAPLEFFPCRNILGAKKLGLKQRRLSSPPFPLGLAAVLEQQQVE
jgi:hypothetical protein